MNAWIFPLARPSSVHLTGNYLDNDDDDDMDPYGDQGLMELQYDESDEDEEADTNNLEIKTKGAQRLCMYKCLNVHWNLSRATTLEYDYQLHLRFTFLPSLPHFVILFFYSQSLLTPRR